jgi:transglutaminase/protease-like cytokinesis protein 3
MVEVDIRDFVDSEVYDERISRTSSQSSSASESESELFLIPQTSVPFSSSKPSSESSSYLYDKKQVVYDLISVAIQGLKIFH